MSSSRHHIPFLASGLLLLAGGLMASCGHKKPEGTISEKKMVSLMVDMQLAEAYANNEYTGGDFREKKKALAKGILEQHGVSQEELDSTLSWYGRNLDDYSKLFEKVDKEINHRKAKIMRIDIEEDVQQGDILWPYQKNGLLTSLGNTDGWILSVDEPSLQKGDMLEWTMHLNKPASLTGVLGVDYSDGTSEALVNQMVSRQKVEMKFQTDTTKTVSRIYGTLRLREGNEPQLFADSIVLHRIPFDSIEFKKYRSQKKYGVPARKKPVAVATTDSLSTDSIEKTVPNDSIVRFKVNPTANKPISTSGKPVRPTHDVNLPPRGSAGPGQTTVQPVRPRKTVRSANTTAPKHKPRNERSK